MVVHLTGAITPTGVGMGSEFFTGGMMDLTLWPLSPCCDADMCYLDSKRPDIKCGGCQRVYREFDGISSSELLHAGPWFQCLQLNTQEMTDDDFMDVEDYIERWTGLTGISFSITV